VSNDPQGWGQRPPGPQGAPPPGAWPHPPSQLPPYGSPWVAPPQPPRRTHRAWIIGGIAGVLVLVAAAVGITMGVTRGHVESPPAPPSTASAPNASAAPPTTIRVLPAQVLASDEQIKQATLIDMTGQGDLDTTVGNDVDTDPANCTLANGPTGRSTVGQAISVAFHAYTEHPAPYFGSTATSYAAVFDTADAAAGALSKITHDVQGCTTYTSHEPGKPPMTWAVSDVKVGDSQISWNNTDQPTDTHWVCGKAIRVYHNVLVTAMLCDQNPADAPAKIVDAVISNVDTHR
jgi:PknH-like protein